MKSEPRLDIMVLAFDVCFIMQLNYMSSLSRYYGPYICLKEVFWVVGELRLSSYIRLTESITVLYILLKRVIFSIAN